MMTRFWWYLDPLSPHRQKNTKNFRVGPPLTKLSGSVHEREEDKRNTDRQIHVK